jgi:hypothetical protein
MQIVITAELILYVFFKLQYLNIIEGPPILHKIWCEIWIDYCAVLWRVNLPTSSWFGIVGSLLACNIAVIQQTFYVTAHKCSLLHDYSGLRLVCLYPLVPRSVKVDVHARENTFLVHICNVAVSFVKVNSIPR